MRGIPLANLRIERQRAGLTLRELEAKSGVKNTTISELENGRRGAQGRTLRKLAGALGISTRDLVDEGFGSPGQWHGRPGGVPGEERQRVRVAVSGAPNVEAARLLESWAREDPGYDRETLPELQRHLDEDRPSYRELFGWQAL